MNEFEDAYRSGITFQDYRANVAALGGLVAEMLDESEQTLAAATIDLEPFNGLAECVPVLVLSENWCGDCTDNLPIVDRIERETGKLRMRIASRDAWPGIMDQFLTRGEFRSIPVIILMDHTWQPLGALRERPEGVTLRRRANIAQVYADHPEFGRQEDSPALLDDETRERLSTFMTEARASSRSFAIAEVVREIEAMARRS